MEKFNLPIRKTYTYEEYMQLAEVVAKDSDDLTDYIRLNLHRMQRLNKTIQINNPELVAVVQQIQKPVLWLVISEVYCGDSAQNIPVIQKITELSPNIELKIVLRSEHPEIMNAFLTNGSQSIPKLICIDATSNQILGTWGPRPQLAQNMVIEYKRNHPEGNKEEMNMALHKWYAQDRGKTLQEEFANLLKNCLNI